MDPSWDKMHRLPARSAQGGPGDSILEATSIAPDRWIHAGSDEPCPAGATVGLPTVQRWSDSRDWCFPFLDDDI